MAYNIKSTEVPKGVWFSTLVMSFPLFTLTGYLGMLAPMAANPAFVDPAQFAFLARSAVRMLSLNLAFIGGVHYGLGAGMWEACREEDELRKTKFQMMFAFVPALTSFFASSILLFSATLTVPTIVFSFSSLMMT